MKPYQAWMSKPEAFRQSRHIGSALAAGAGDAERLQLSAPRKLDRGRDTAEDERHLVGEHVGDALAEPL